MARLRTWPYWLTLIAAGVVCTFRVRSDAIWDLSDVRYRHARVSTMSALGHVWMDLTWDDRETAPAEYKTAGWAPIAGRLYGAPWYTCPIGPNNTAALTNPVEPVGTRFYVGGGGFAVAVVNSSSGSAPSNEVRVQVPHWSLLTAAILPAAARWRSDRRGRRRWRDRQCLRCGYDLCHSIGRCPECGGLIDPRTPGSPARPPAGG